MDGEDGWERVGYDEWRDVRVIRAALRAGADPDDVAGPWGPPLQAAVELGPPEVVAEIARHVTDVDAEHEGRTALWRAVYANRTDHARVLVRAGADPWRPMMAGWSPGRLSLAGPTPDLFALPPNADAPQFRLSADEAAAASGAHLLRAALSGGRGLVGIGVACVAGVDVAEVVRRLSATIVPAGEMGAVLADGASVWQGGYLDVVGVTAVPGGCVVSQPWGYAPSMPGLTRALSPGTVCYAMYANPKSGNQGSVARDGANVASDLHPGGGVDARATPEGILLSYLYAHDAIAYSCAYAGLRVDDARSVTGPPDTWVRLPTADWWR